MPEPPFLAARGGHAEVSSLSPRPRELAQRLAEEDLAFASLIETRRCDGVDIVVLDVSLQLPQDRVHDIRPTERVSVEFATDDDRTPEVLALRASFPGVSHLNRRDDVLPRSLCLFEDPWDEIQLSWTPARFIGVLRNWLELTARGSLHAGDQPLEPLLLGTGMRIVVPAGRPESWESDRLAVLGIQTPEMNRPVFIARRHEDVGEAELSYVRPYVATVVVAEPQEHGVIERTPTTLEQLGELLAPAGVHLAEHLAARLETWRQEGDLLEHQLILITLLPKVRASGEPVEASDVFAFLVEDKVGALGEQLGLWELRDGHAAPVILAAPSALGDQSILCLHPVQELTLDVAARAAGRTPDPRTFVAVGQGALGSQVVANLVRMGFGNWTLIDNDMLLPHNLTRHAVLGRAMGFPKATYTASILTETVHGLKASPLVCDVLRPDSKAGALKGAVEAADVVMDFSASRSVAQHLALDIAGGGRRVVFFLSPNARFLVLLAEDEERAVRLDELEAQFHRLLSRYSILDSFYRESPTALRYGGSCGDLSMHISQDRVGIHAGLCARAVCDLGAEGQVSVWKITDELSIERAVEGGFEVQWFEDASWAVGIDSDLVAHLIRMRRPALPSETGGVLVGTVDAQRKRIVIVDALEAPPDSREWPTAFIRGSTGLADEVGRIQERSGHGVSYIGEWHSHPPGASLELSGDDRNVLRFVSRHMKGEGLPGIVLIVGNNEVRCHIGGA